jgi:hypothetical protein
MILKLTLLPCIQGLKRWLVANVLLHPSFFLISKPFSQRINTVLYHIRHDLSLLLLLSMLDHCLRACYTLVTVISEQRNSLDPVFLLHSVYVRLSHTHPLEKLRKRAQTVNPESHDVIKIHHNKELHPHKLHLNYTLQLNVLINELRQFHPFALLNFHIIEQLLKIFLFQATIPL